MVFAVFVAHAFERVAHIFQRSLPVHRLPFPAVFDFRLSQAAFVVQAFIRETVFVRQPAFVNSFVFARQHAAHGVFFGLHFQIRAQRVVRGHGFAAAQLPRPSVETERFAGQCAHGAEVNHVARQFGFHRFADKRHDFGQFAAVGHADFLLARNFFGKAYAAGAVDAAAHFLRGNQRAHFFGFDGAFFFSVTAGRHTVAHRQILQLALAALVAHGAVQRVVDEQEFHHAFLRLLGFGRMRVHHHAVRYRRGAGGQWFGGFFHFHQTHAAVSGNGEFFVVTEMRDICPQLVRGFHYGCALLYFNLFAVYLDL